MKISKQALLDSINKALDANEANKAAYAEACERWQVKRRERWHAEKAPQWKALRDLLTKKLNKSQPITEEDVQAVLVRRNGYRSSYLNDHTFSEKALPPNPVELGGQKFYAPLGTGHGAAGVEGVPRSVVGGGVLDDFPGPAGVQGTRLGVPLRSHIVTELDERDAPTELKLTMRYNHPWWRAIVECVNAAMASGGGIPTVCMTVKLDGVAQEFVFTGDVASEFGFHGEARYTSTWRGLEIAQ